MRHKARWDELLMMPHIMKVIIYPFCLRKSRGETLTLLVLTMDANKYIYKEVSILTNVLSSAIPTYIPHQPSSLPLNPKLTAIATNKPTQSTVGP